METDLERLRELIDQIDKELVGLLNQRATMALEIGKLKAKSGTTVYDPTRERAVLDKIDRLNNGPLDKGAMEEIFSTVMTACREIQSKWT